MKDKLSIVVATVFVAVVSATGWAIESATIGYPTGFASFPPSNIRGGGDFSGMAPYRAGSRFGAVTSSSSLDSFLRRSIGSRDYGQYNRGTYRRFYSPSRTVTTTRLGQVGVILPPTMEIGGSTASNGAVGTLPFVPRKQTLSYEGDWGFGGRDGSADPAGFQVRENLLRVPALNAGTISGKPMSMTLREMERAILAEVDIDVYRGKDRMLPRGGSTAAQESWSEQFRWKLEGAATVDNGLTKRLIERDESLWRRTSKVLEGDTLRRFELQSLKEEALEGEDRRDEHDKEQGIEFDVYEQTKQKIGELQRSYEQLVAEKAAQRMLGTVKGVGEGSHVAAFRKMAPQSTGAGNGEEMSSEERSGFAASVSARIGKKKLGFSVADAVRSDLAKSGQPSLERPVSSEGRISDGMRGTRGTELSARAKAILGSYRSLESFWNDKFNQHVVAGEKYLRGGKYYRSASAYTLALIYKPEEPLAYMGKSHALFAAGEYVSSALFLSRAIIAAGEERETKHYTVQQLLVLGSEFLGYVDKDKLERRLADVEQWRQRSNSAELQFLLAYIYYQMGRLDAAREAIDGAYEKMPEAPAPIALREVIGSTKQPHEDKNR